MVHAVLPIPGGSAGQEIFPEVWAFDLDLLSNHMKPLFHSRGTCSSTRSSSLIYNLLHCSNPGKLQTSASSLYQSTSSILSWKMIYAVLRVWLEMIDTDGKQKKETEWGLQEASIKVLKCAFAELTPSSYEVACTNMVDFSCHWIRRRLGLSGCRWYLGPFAQV